MADDAHTSGRVEMTGVFAVLSREATAVARSIGRMAAESDDPAPAREALGSLDRMRAAVQGEVRRREERAVASAATPVDAAALAAVAEGLVKAYRRLDSNEQMLTHLAESGTSTVSALKKVHALLGAVGERLERLERELLDDEGAPVADDDDRKADA